jgi:hypothetical protein
MNGAPSDEAARRGQEWAAGFMNRDWWAFSRGYDSAIARLEEALARLRCEVSGNPCNTDCRMVGRPPCCETCRWHLAATQEEVSDE